MMKFVFAPLMLAANLSAGPTYTVETYPNPTKLQTLQTASLNNDGSPYWDNWSNDTNWDNVTGVKNNDGLHKNIGYCLTTNNCGISPRSSLANLAWYGNVDGSKALETFYDFGGLPLQWELLQEISGLSKVNEIGWYDPANPAKRNTIFTGSATRGALAQIQPPGVFGLYLRTKTPNEQVFYSEGHRNPIGTREDPHFALFRDGTMFVLGVEDIRPKPEHLGDFNDLIIGIKYNNSDIPKIPEPPTIALAAMGAGLVALGLARKKK